MVLIISLKNIRNDYNGFSQIINLARELEPVLFKDIEIDMSRVDWFEANMCAPLGAVLYKASRRLNSVIISNLQAKVEKILRKNGFLGNYGRSPVSDTYGTTIPYQRFEPKDDRYFGAYISRHLVGKGIPEMSVGLRKKFQESIFEIFSNAVIHSQTPLGIYSCGQFFPNKNCLDFSIADLGIGICRNLQQKVGLVFSSEKAIEWALTGRNTTKTGPIPGGLGLKLLREFLTLNQGRMQIVSDRGYLELSEGEVILQSFSYPFPGTVVNLEFNTSDTKSYCLQSELRSEDIF